MRCKDVTRALLLHWLFLLSIFTVAHLFRRILPSYAGTDLLFSSSLTSEEVNDKRIQYAEAVINSSLLREVPKREDLEIRVVAADRRRGYLIQVIGYLLDAYNPSVPHISICNVEETIFPELERFQKTIKIHQLTGGPMNRRNLTLAIKKETRDYWECLAAPSVAKYVMLLEDDSLVIPQFPTLMKSLVSQLDRRREIDYVKLYHPIHLRKLPSIPITIISAISLMCLFNVFLYGRRPHVLFLPATVILYVILRSFSSQFIADFRFFLTGSAYISVPESCCTPAVVFRSESKDAMVTELSREESHAGRAKDHILDESRFVGRQSDMNWVVHIGAFSHVRDRPVKLSDQHSLWQQNAKKGWLKYFL